MDDFDTDSAALDKILGDMDDMESQRVYGDKPAPAEGVSITIDVAPKAAAPVEKKEEKVVEEPMAEPIVEDDSMLPPFLRKKRK